MKVLYGDCGVSSWPPPEDITSSQTSLRRVPGLSVRVFREAIGSDETQVVCLVGDGTPSHGTLGPSGQVFPFFPRSTGSPRKLTCLSRSWPLSTRVTVGASTAYHLSLRGVKPLVVERSAVAAAASGKAGGFLAGGWGSGPTVPLHEVSFAMHERLAEELGVTSYRKIPTLQASPRRAGCRTRVGPSPMPPSADGRVARSHLLRPSDDGLDRHRTRKHILSSCQNRWISWYSPAPRSIGGVFLPQHTPFLINSTCRIPYRDLDACNVPGSRTRRSFGIGL